MKLRTCDNIRTAVTILSAISVGVFWVSVIHGIFMKIELFTTLETLAIITGMFLDGVVIGIVLSWIVEKLIWWLFKDFIEK